MATSASAESSVSSTDSSKPRVAIVGAGLAGVAMAAALKNYEIDFVVLEAQSGWGGLWRQAYPQASGT